MDHATAESPSQAPTQHEPTERVGEIKEGRGTRVNAKTREAEQKGRKDSTPGTIRFVREHGGKDFPKESAAVVGDLYGLTPSLRKRRVWPEVPQVQLASAADVAAVRFTGEWSSPVWATGRTGKSLGPCT